MHNDAIVGVAPEFSYNENLKINDVKINFDLDNSIVNDYNSMYNDVSDEFVGIKRFNVFRYFEDTNMLLPIETFHDVPNNRVYAHYNEMGTYCLIDMTKWLDSLGYINNSDQSAMTFAMERTAEATESNEIDVVFLLYAQPAQAKFIKEELTNVVNTVYDNANDVHMYFMINDGSDVIPYMTSGRNYAQTKAEALAITNRLTFPVSNSVYLYKGFKAVSELTLRDDAQKHLFLIDGVFEPKTDTENVFLKRILDKNVNFGVVCDVVNSNLTYYRSISEGNVKNSHIVFNSFITDQISFPIDTEKDYIITSNGLMAIPENFGKISADSTQDYDEDGLPDVIEINFGVTGENGNTLITVNADGSVVLPCFNECVYAGGTYVESGLKRFYDEEDNSVLEFLDGIRVLPIFSDPTSPDGDGDGILDIDEHEASDITINDALLTNHIVNLKSITSKNSMPMLLSEEGEDNIFNSVDDTDDNFFSTNIKDIVVDGDDNIDSAYPLAQKYNITGSINDSEVSYGILGDKNDTYYLEAYTFVNDSGERENHLSINVNVRFTARSMKLDGNTTVSRDEMLKAISKKWSKTYESTNEYDFRKGMKIMTDVTFNLVSKKDGGQDKIRYYDYINNGTNLNEDKTLTNYTYIYLNDGTLAGSSNSDDDYNNKHDGVVKGHSTTSTDLEGIKYMYLFKYDDTNKANSKDDICRAISHEFGHVLGIMDAYGQNNPTNYFVEPISRHTAISYDGVSDIDFSEKIEDIYKVNDEIYFNIGAFSKKNGKLYFDPSRLTEDQKGEMMHRSGVVSVNDIEMILYAKKTNELQYFVPIGRICTYNDNGTYTTLETFTISKAIKQKTFYIFTYDVDEDGLKFSHGSICWYDSGIYKPVEVVGKTETELEKQKNEIMLAWGDDFDDVYYNHVIELCKDANGNKYFYRYYGNNYCIEK